MTTLPGTVPYCTCMRLDEPRRQPECLPDPVCMKFTSSSLVSLYTAASRCACDRVKPEHLPHCHACHVALSGERFSERVVA